MASSYFEFWPTNKATYGELDQKINNQRSIWWGWRDNEINSWKYFHQFLNNSTICFELREVNEDNVLVRNVLVEFEDSLKYVSFQTRTDNLLHNWLIGTDSTAPPPLDGQAPQPKKKVPSPTPKKNFSNQKKNPQPK